MDTITLLKKVRIFEGLSDEDLEKFAAISAEDSFPPDSVIIEEGVEGRALYIVKRGTVRVSKLESETETELTKLVAGEAVGEMSLIEDTVTSARVSAVNDVDCLIIPRDAFLDLMERDVHIAAKVYFNFTRIMSERLRITSQELFTWKPEISM